MIVKKPSRTTYIIMLGLLAALGPLCTDLYLPALPELASELNASTATAQLSLTAGLLGLGAGQLIFGPLSDKLGRIKPLLVSLLLFLFSSLWCAFAPDINQLLIARLIQGLSGSGGAVLALAVARDMNSGHELTRFLALLMMVNGLAPILAPVLGGALLLILDWRGLFITLAVMALVLVLLSGWKLRESLPIERRSQGSVFSVWLQLGKIIKHRLFMGFCLTQGFMMSGMFAYIGASPFVLQQLYGLSPIEFSLYFAINGAGLIIAAQGAAYLSARLGEYRVLKGGLIIAAAAVSSLLLLSWLQAHLIFILISLTLTISCNSIIASTASSLAMESQGSQAGSASAVIGVCMFMLGALSVPITGIGGTSVLTMAMSIFGSYSLAILVFLFLTKAYSTSHGRESEQENVLSEHVG